MIDFSLSNEDGASGASLLHPRKRGGRVHLLWHFGRNTLCKQCQAGAGIQTETVWARAIIRILQFNSVKVSRLSLKCDTTKTLTLEYGMPCQVPLRVSRSREGAALSES